MAESAVYWILLNSALPLEVIFQMYTFAILGHLVETMALRFFKDGIRNRIIEGNMDFSIKDI